jgi:hypothetical protein
MIILRVHGCLLTFVREHRLEISISNGPYKVQLLDLTWIEKLFSKPYSVLCSLISELEVVHGPVPKTLKALDWSEVQRSVLKYRLCACVTKTALGN